ncbi:MAG: T9SS type A sorting domain-containing protein [Bacteroidota bacterium]
MKKFCLQFLAFNILLLINSPVPCQSIFTATYSTSWGGNEINSNKIFQKHDNGFLITASPQQGLHPPTFICSTDSSGNILWGGIYNDGLLGYSTFDVTNVAEMDDGGVLLAGTYDTTSAGLDSMHYVIMRLDSAGNVVWEKSLHHLAAFTDEKFTCITNAFNGGFILTGNLGIIIKTDSAGNIQWTKSIGYSTINKLVPVSNLNYLAIVNDNTIIKFDSSFNILWSKNYIHSRIVLTSIIETADGGYAAGGLFDSTGFSSIGSLFLLKTDSGGNLLFALKSDSSFISRMECPVNIIEMPDSQLILSCSPIESGVESNLFLRLDANGNILRSMIWNSITGVFHARTTDITRTANNGFAFLMKYTYSSSADTQLRLVTIDSQDSTNCGTRYFQLNWIPDSIGVSSQNFTLQSVNLVETSRPSYNTSTTNNQFFCVLPDYVDELKSHLDFSVSPNPFTSSLTFHCQEPQIEKAHLSIFNSLGIMVSEKEIKDEDKTLNLPPLPQGIYLLNIITEKEIYSAKIVHD